LIRISVEGKHVTGLNPATKNYLGCLFSILMAIVWMVTTVIILVFVSLVIVAVRGWFRFAGTIAIGLLVILDIWYAFRIRKLRNGEDGATNLLTEMLLILAGLTIILYAVLHLML
jgi:cbb3-type cytochrome oxidase subunit 3